jgi:undecaprenyl-diphosphatase
MTSFLGQWLSTGRNLLRAEGRILIPLMIAAVALIAFFKFASEVMEGATMAFDSWLLVALRNPADPSVPIGPEWLNAAMLDITALGGVAGLTILTMVVVGYLLVARKAAMAVFLAGAVIGGASLGTLLKLGFHRARPELVAHLVQVSTTSFPSGHAVNSAVVYLTLGALLARTHSEPHVRFYLLSVAALLTLAIGCSRVYLGVHWPSDVLAGWIIGATWALLCSLVARNLQNQHRIELPTQQSAQ